MSIKVLLYLYIVFVFFISLSSYKKGIYLIWATLFMFPTILVQMTMNLYMSFLNILIIGSFFSEILRGNLTDYKIFFAKHKNAIGWYVVVSLAILFMSQTVPLGYQFRRFINEVCILLFSIQTLLLIKRNKDASKALLLIVLGAISFNILYSFYFEVYLRSNPAGLPLYVLLGQGENDYLVDMIDSERGDMAFRAQSVYGHPLSLGQYMLVFLPVLYVVRERLVKIFFSIAIVVLIGLTGTRGAIVPMVLILLLMNVTSLSTKIPKLVGLISIVFILFLMLPNTVTDKFVKRIEPFTANLQFWDDKKQREQNITGSSMELRIQQMDAALDEVSNNPLFGRGYGYREFWQNKHRGVHPVLLGYESVLLYYLVERGWVGLIFYFIMVYYLYRLFSTESKQKYTIGLILFGLVLSQVMTGVRPLALLFACLASSITCGMYPSISRKSHTKL